MKRITMLLVMNLLVSLYLGLPMARANGDETGKLKEELQLLKSQFNELKAGYENRISELEKKITEAPTPLPGMKKQVMNLPDISFVGDVAGTYGDDIDESDRKKIILRETELALQGYLYPDIRADVFAALHRHSDDGEYKAELEEGYISFLKTPVEGLSLKAGKKLLDFGKLNPIHTHHWNFVDRPEVLKSYFGDHGVATQGVNFSYLVPLPFFLQADFGIWHVDSEHTHSGDILGLADETYSTRLWSSFDLTQDQELEVGVSGVKSYGSHYAEHKDKVKVAGLDLTYRHIGKGYERLLFQNEFLFMDRDVPAGDLDRFGCYSLLNYRLDKYWDIGVRYDWMETPFPEEKEKTFISTILTRALTETTKLRLQYKYDMKNDDHTIYLQTTFGIGPHAHPLE